ncbi:transcription factor HIVEP3 [Alosa sapidissima]|uniref:transcription factor HIVEP3 n=1 Tax=Alosa sapidissima TaxID=34773 RepID=UPI001C084E56|nr:transcription factor HIVEP3 [Alosa sapidissima]XP_041964493.1 transcription factor HIVEP3 [Alosa sapidissima]XP_041964494.1 transcription factor HIVEP3 [Alosa sapidissima]
MEAEHSRLTEGEQSGGQPSQQQQQHPHLSEPQLLASLPHSPHLKSQQRAASRSVHGYFVRRQHRQPKRSDMLQGLHQQQQQQQQRNQVSEAGTASWQLQNVPGPSSSSFRAPSSVTSSSTVSSSSNPVQPSQGASSQQGQEGQEGGAPSRRERKPQKPGKYVCTYCGRPCAKPSVLQKHIRSHTGERPYPCVPCGFSFKTKSNLYKHRKSHAHRIKVGSVSSRDDHGVSGPEGGAGGDEQGDPTEGESTDSEDETGRHHPSTSQDRPTLKKSSHVELSFSEDSLRPEAVKQRLAMRLSERNRLPKALPDEHTSSLGPGSKGSTESGYYSSLSGSSDLSQVSSPNANAKSYAEIILGKYGRLGQQPRSPQQQPPQSSSVSSSLPSGPEEKTIPFTVPKVIEHITKLITINEAVVDTSEIDSVKPRRSSVSRRDSIEFPKFSSPKEISDAGTISGHSSHGVYSSEMLSPMSSDSEFLSSQGLSSVFLRSHSMPSPAGQEDPASTSSCGFRLCQSFDEQQGREMRVGHHHRMLRRQPAIEVPLGGELIPTESGVSTSVAKDAVMGLRQFKGLIIYDCEACGTSWKEQESYEAHRDLCVGRLSQELPKGKEAIAFREDRPQMMQNKFRALAMAMRKRRKEESLEEDPPSPGPAAVTFSHEAMKSLPGVEKHTDFPIGVICEAEQERKTTWKEISVIQHTSSFEKQESMSMESQETEFEEQLQQTEQQPKSSPIASRLVRQSNIQVPEILVTEEPDTDMVLSSPPVVPSSSKEPEKVEEFQWPQRSQSLAQLPAEKLPPKKKRLRLAEASQSSGESSFESVSLSRSPSQESSVSHTSSRSASFEDSSKPESEMQMAKGSHGSHMLTVPSGHHQHHYSHREMRRSASEQTPASPPHPSQIVESRSKSFDYGSLSPQQSSASWKERRKCLLVKHATLGEPDQEDISTGQLVKLSSPKVYRSYPSPPTFAPEDYSMTNISTSSRLSSESIGKTLQLFQPPLLPIPQTPLPFHPVGPEAFTPRHLARFLPVTTAISDVLSTQFLHRAFLQAPSPQFHPTQLNITERLGFPLQPLQSLLPLHGQSDITQAVYFPMPGGLTIQVPAELPYRNPQPSSSVLSSGTANQQLMPSHPHPRPIIAPCLEQFTPVVSLVVPVRLQTHIPTYASAMYTTLSQILVTTRSQEPICCTAMVIMGQLEESKLQRSYLKIPSPHFKTCLPMSLEYSVGAGSDEGPLGAGGSKRMLSPAGSLELSSEAQRQQKRVKEEEEYEEEDEEEEEEDKGRSKDATEPEKKVDPVRHLKMEQAKEKSRVVGEMTQEGGGKVEMKEREKAAGATRQESSRVNMDTLKKEEREDEGHGKTHWIEGVARSKQPTYPSLHTTTSVSWCYLNYIKPNPTTQQDPQTSVYSSWSISLHNPNLPGLSTKMVMSLLHSKQKHSLETYTMAMAPPPSVGKLVTSSNRNPRVSEVHSAPPSTPVKVKEEPSQENKETKAKSEEESPSASKQSELPRIRIFEGGYKSNEEYVYVRGRGRGKYVCGECGIRCKKPSMLKKHIRTHTDVRPYVCKHCNFAFKTKGNLTKHMKSKAHSKKCLEMGISGSSLDDPDEAGGSEEPAFGSEDPEEHQFSDIEDSEEGDDNEEEDEDDDCSSHDDPPSSCSTDTRPSTGGQSDSGQSLQLDLPEHPSFPHSSGSSHDYPSPRRPWPGTRAASPGSKRAMFSRRRWEASPRAFSPAREGASGSAFRSLSPRLELSSPSRHLSPSPERGPSPSPIRPLSPLRPLSPMRPLSPGHYRSSRAMLTPSPLRAQHYRHHSSPAHLPWDSTCTHTTRSEPRQERPGTPRDGLTIPEASLFPPALRLPSGSTFGSGFGSVFGSEPVPAGAPRMVNHMFSHLPLHSQDQARMPYHMIPIGGIQMVQARPRAKLERNPSSTVSSPTSPKEDIALFYVTSPGTSDARTPKDYKSHTSHEGSRQPGPGFPGVSSTLPTVASLQPGKQKPDTTERKQHGSLHTHTSPTGTHSLVTERTDAPEQITHRLSDLRVSSFSSNQRTRQLPDREEPPSRRGSSLAEREEEGGDFTSASRRRGCSQADT